MKIAAALFSVLLLFFFSCASIPCEKKIIEKNLFEEYFSIAERYKNLEDYSKAIEYYSKALPSKSLHGYAFYEIALCNVYLKNWNEAKSSFETLLQNDSENTTLKSSLAYIEAMRGNLEKAESLYASLYENNPDDSFVLKNLIAVLAAEKKYEEADKNLNLLEEKFPDESSIPDIKKKLKEFLPDQESEAEEE